MAFSLKRARGTQTVYTDTIEDDGSGVVTIESNTSVTGDLSVSGSTTVNGDLNFTSPFQIDTTTTMNYVTDLYHFRFNNPSNIGEEENGFDATESDLANNITIASDTERTFLSFGATRYLPPSVNVCHLSMDPTPFGSIVNYCFSVWLKFENISGALRAVFVIENPVVSTDFHALYVSPTVNSIFYQCNKAGGFNTFSVSRTNNGYNRWTHVAGNFTKSQVDLYVDGAKSSVSVGSYAAFSDMSITSARIGRGANTGGASGSWPYSSGGIDELIFFANKTFTDQEVLDLYNEVPSVLRVGVVDSVPRISMNTTDQSIKLESSVGLGGDGVIVPFVADADGREIQFINLTAPQFRPVAADTDLIDLGASAARWKDVYAKSVITDTLTLPSWGRFEAFSLNPFSISNTTLTTLTNTYWDSVLVNTGYTSFTSGVLTIAVAGVYVITANVAFDSSSAGTVRQLFVEIDATYNAFASTRPSTSYEDLLSCSMTKSLGVGDTIKVQVFHDAGAPVDVLIGSAFTVHRIL